jgi:hypothetical protein
MRRFSSGGMIELFANKDNPALAKSNQHGRSSLRILATALRLFCRGKSIRIGRKGDTSF